MSVTYRLHIACRREHGFTLIEAMIVVTLLAILSTIAVPSFRTLLANNRVSSAQSELQALLLYARAEAVYQRTGMAVSMDIKHRHWQVFRATKNGNAVTLIGDAVRETQLPKTLSVFASGNALGDAAVYFDAAGKATLNSGVPFIRIVEPAAQGHRCLHVTAAGLVRRPAC